MMILYKFLKGELGIYNYYPDESLGTILTVSMPQLPNEGRLYIVQQTGEYYIPLDEWFHDYTTPTTYELELFKLTHNIDLSNYLQQGDL